jgi:hypothetical protein
MFEKLLLDLGLLIRNPIQIGIEVILIKAAQVEDFRTSM